MSLGPIYIVGAGRVGTALALLARRAGLDLIGLWTRSQVSAARVEQAVGLPCAWGAMPDDVGRARLVIASVRDPEVPTVCGALLDGGLLRSCRAVLHCGGARSAAEAMANLVPSVPVGTFHPLVAAASPEQAARAMPDAYFAIEGDRQARDLAMQLARGLEVSWFELDGALMTPYHAAAVMASNHAVALWHAATRLLGETGLERARCQEVLLPLLRSTLENVARMPLEEALTGPVRRGDPETVARHLEMLGQRLPELADIYRAGTAQAVDLTRRSGEDLDEALGAIQRVIRRTDPAG